MMAGRDAMPAVVVAGGAVSVPAGVADRFGTETLNTRDGVVCVRVVEWSVRRRAAKRAVMSASSWIASAANSVKAAGVRLALAETSAALVELSVSDAAAELAEVGAADAVLVACSGASVAAAGCCWAASLALAAASPCPHPTGFLDAVVCDLVA